MEIRQLLLAGKETLKRSGVESPEIDCQLLLGHCINMSRTQMLLHGSEHVEEKKYKKFLSFIKRRAAREPVAYILEEREFWSLPFYVNKNVLVPRPETEFLLETVLSKINGSGCKIDRCVDLCCGSGVISVILAKELQSKVIAFDISEKALQVAKINSKEHNVDHLVTYVLSDLFSSLNEKYRFPLIVSNPPYVTRSEIYEVLEPEVVDFEPMLALDGGKDGLDCVRRIAGDIIRFLSPSGMFLMEFGSGQAEKIYEIFSNVTFKDRFCQTIDILQDYSGRDRVLFVKINNYCE